MSFILVLDWWFSTPLQPWWSGIYSEVNFTATIFDECWPKWRSGKYQCKLQIPRHTFSQNSHKGSAKIDSLIKSSLISIYQVFQILAIYNYDPIRPLATRAIFLRGISTLACVIAYAISWFERLVFIVTFTEFYFRWQLLFLRCIIIIYL